PADDRDEPDRRRPLARVRRHRAREGRRVTAAPRTGVTLAVEHLRVELADGVDIVDDVTFEIGAGEVLGVVGESGSGKTTVGLAVLGHQRRGARIAAGEVRIEGENILAKSAAELRSMRGRVISYVPQDPSSALNPALRVGTQLLETLEAHGFGSSDAERRARLPGMPEGGPRPGGARFPPPPPPPPPGGRAAPGGPAEARARAPP